MEYFDILDCRAGKTGGLVQREEAHRSGVWHGAFHCLIGYKRDGAAYALFQKRSVSKKIAGGRFDVSVGGHYAAGEQAPVAGPREIREELGLEVKFEELLPLGRRVFVYCFEPGVTEYEFQDVYLLPREPEPGEIRLQTEEVDCLLEMEVDRGIQLLSRERESVSCRLLLPDSGSRTHPATADEFVPCLDNYYLKLLLLVKRYFQGERNLFI